MMKKGDSHDDTVTPVDDRFYRDLSQDSHLSWPGLARRAAFLLLDHPSKYDYEKLYQQKSDAMMDAVVMLLAMLSEIHASYASYKRELGSD